MAFFIWGILGLAFVVMGIYFFFTKNEKPSGFWANAKRFPIEDIKGYNRAMGKLWCIFGLVFVLLGLPLLSEQNTPFILLSVLGMMVEVIVVMVIYTMVIEKKYRKRDGT